MAEGHLPDVSILPLSSLPLAAAGAGGLWETRSVFQGVWEGAGRGAGAAAFHTPADRRPGVMGAGGKRGRFPHKIVENSHTTAGRPG